MKATVIGNLPKEGELTPTAKEEAKLAALLPLLALQGREPDMEVLDFPTRERFVEELTTHDYDIVEGSSLSRGALPRARRRW